MGNLQLLEEIPNIEKKVRNDKWLSEKVPGELADY
jgi:hypothetical protein